MKLAKQLILTLKHSLTGKSSDNWHQDNGKIIHRIKAILSQFVWTKAVSYLPRCLLTTYA